MWLEDLRAIRRVSFEGFRGPGLQIVGRGEGGLEPLRSVTRWLELKAPSGGYHREMASSGDPRLARSISVFTAYSRRRTASGPPGPLHPRVSGPRALLNSRRSPRHPMRRAFGAASSAAVIGRRGAYRSTKSSRSRGIGLGLALAAAVVLGVGHQPEFLGLLAMVETALRRSPGRCRRRAAPWIISQGRGASRRHRRLDVGEPAVQSPLRPAAAGPGQEAVEPSRDQSAAGTGSARRSRPSGGCRRPSCRWSGTHRR